MLEACQCLKLQAVTGLLATVLPARTSYGLSHYNNATGYHWSLDQFSGKARSSILLAIGPGISSG